MNTSVPALLVICGLLIVIVLVLFWHPQRSRAKTHTFAHHWRTNAVFRDDDRYWSGGIFYNNPNDPDQSFFLSFHGSLEDATDGAERMSSQFQYFNTH